MVNLSHITITKSDRRTISIHITPSAEVLVKAPKRASESQINDFVMQHADWIEKHIAHVQKHQIVRDHGEYYFLGESLTLSPYDGTIIKIDGKNLLIPHAMLLRQDKELTRWYIEQAERVISQQVEKLAKEMKTTYTSVSFADTKSRWGACTHDNRLQFNWRLIMAPLMVINYVVVHELAHTMEKNHTQLFWMKVRSINPSYRQQIKWLKDFGSTLNV